MPVVLTNYTVKFGTSTTTVQSTDPEGAARSALAELTSSLPEPDISAVEVKVLSGTKVVYSATHPVDMPRLDPCAEGRHRKILHTDGTTRCEICEEVVQ